MFFNPFAAVIRPMLAPSVLLTKSMNLVICLLLMYDGYFLSDWRKDRLYKERQRASWGAFSVIFQSRFDSNQFNVN